MRWGAFVLLLLSISLTLYFVGYRPIINVIEDKGESPLSIACETEDAFCDNQEVILGAIFLTLTAAAGLTALVLGYSAIYIIPILLLMALLSFFIYPLDFLMGAPDIIRYPVLAVFNVLSVLAVMDFVRGRA